MLIKCLLIKCMLIKCLLIKCVLDKVCGDKVCVEKVFVDKVYGDKVWRRAEEEKAAEEEPGIQNQKQEPHTKMWGKNRLMLLGLAVGTSSQKGQVMRGSTDTDTGGPNT